MAGFIKTDGELPSLPKLGGFQKTAIFLGEIGVDASRAVLSHLNLSDAQVTAISKAMRNLGEFNPHNQLHVMRENSVLEEAANYGKMRRIYREIPHLTPSEEKVNKISTKDPKQIAQILRMMLDEK